MPTYDVTTPKQALANAYDNVLKSQADEREAERQAEQARRRAAKRPRLLVVAAVLLLNVTAGWMWHTRPDWIFRPTSIAESTAVKEASLRIMMSNAAQHVERYRTRYGQLPKSLRSAGAHGQNIQYVIDGSNAYRLIGSNDQIALTLRSDQPLPAFIGNSFALVASRRTP